MLITTLRIPSLFQQAQGGAIRQVRGWTDFQNCTFLYNMGTVRDPMFLFCAWTISALIIIYVS